MDKPVLHYVTDALCGWCFGFGPVMLKLQEQYKDKLHVNVINGGMITGERVQPISASADYIKNAIPRVVETTGVPFGDAYIEVLEKGTYINNSFPPAVALAILRDAAPQRALEFAHAIQKAMFVEGKNLNDADTYVELAASAGLDRDSFMERYASEHYKNQALYEFQVVQQWGIQGFPVVIMQKKDKMAMAAQGYLPFETLVQNIDQLLEMDFDAIPVQA
ncbi:MAG: DsbA family protein [Hymenobacteraceae bacterium]|nr:DsbA family protein [Hymenobacteraceae bacterium]MDX5397225.1 DsbA family protein [Hymenobacteraceae bacterium]MDX5513301.1 DsbA family protein [Hymenobacteraceae bacterium]